MKNIYVLTTVLIFGLGLIKIGYGEKILVLSFMALPSHQMTFEPLLEELAIRGHSVTLASPNKIKKDGQIKNLKHIQTVNLKDFFHLPNVFQLKRKGIKVDAITVLKTYSNVCLRTLESPAAQQIKDSFNIENVDLIIIPLLVNECGLAYAYKYFNGVPIILFSVVSAPPFMTTLYGNPSPPSFIPFLFTGYSQKMSIVERLHSFLMEGFVRTMVYFFLFPSFENEYRKILEDPNIPSIEQLVKNTSLILSNSHFTISYKRPFLPDIIDVGGLHCHPPNPLPKELSEFVGGDDGFIYFSMGTHLKTGDIPEDTLELILKVFGKLPQKILWKWHTNDTTNRPPNVMMKTWLPQQDVLGHPNIKLFITHGGFGSTTEAVYHGVPLLGIPVFTDQDMNMKFSVESGIALSIDFNAITEDTLTQAINTLINEPKYLENSKRLSSYFRDQPETPMERAVFWTEYVIRHKGAPILRSAARDLNFFEYHSIDLIAIIFSSITGISLLIYFTLKFLKGKLLNIFLKQDTQKFNRKKNN